MCRHVAKGGKVQLRILEIDGEMCFFVLFIVFLITNRLGIKTPGSRIITTPEGLFVREGNKVASGSMFLHIGSTT